MNLMTFLFAPDPDDLRHDAGEVGVHQLAPECLCGALGDEIEYANTKPAHESPLRWTVRSNG
jgi:hypothetical protein